MTSSSPFPDSQSLYAACQSEQTAVQAAAYEDLWHYLYRRAHYIIRDQPAADALAQDLAQEALERIHQRLEECREPAAFRSWAKRIVSNMAIDELRRRQRLLFDDALPPAASLKQTPTLDSPERTVTAASTFAHLLQLLADAPISDRSRRVVSGRYIDDLPDEELADSESELAQQELLPSHIQVTRAKNMAKLRHWLPLQQFFGKVDSP